LAGEPLVSFFQSTENGGREMTNGKNNQRLHFNSKANTVIASLALIGAIMCLAAPANSQVGVPCNGHDESSNNDVVYIGRLWYMGGMIPQITDYIACCVRYDGDYTTFSAWHIDNIDYIYSYLQDGDDILYTTMGTDCGSEDWYVDHWYDGWSDVQLWVDGGEGDDWAEGGPNTDVFFGGDGTGSDTFDGREGVDYIYGELGPDCLYGGDDSDYIYGDYNDYGASGDSCDYIDGGDGWNTCYCGGGGYDIRSNCVYPELDDSDCESWNATCDYCS
jgi:Ca2+-binding RTX toxin-like protein